MLKFTGFCRFPFKRKELLAKWIKAIRRDKWEPTSTTFICSVHFSESCFRRYSLQIRLKEDAVPSIFDFPAHMQKKVHKQQQPPAIKQETVPSMSTLEDFPISPVSEDHKMLQQNVHSGQQALTHEVVPSKLLTPDMPTTSTSYSCNVDDEKLHMQDPMIKCEVVLPASVMPDLPTVSASSLCDDAQELERTVEKSPIKYLAVPTTSAASVKSDFPATSAMSQCGYDDARVHGQQSLITYKVVPMTSTSARPNVSTGSATSSSNDTEMRSAQDLSVTNMHTYAITTSPHLLKLKYEQLIQYERKRYKELYKRLAVAQRCLQRRKVRMDLMKSTIKQLKLKIKQGSATSRCEIGRGNLTATT